METFEGDRLIIRPRKEKAEDTNHKWLKYRLIDASKDPSLDNEILFVPWPEDGDGVFEFVPINFMQVMQLQHEDGSLGVYTDKEIGYQLYHTMETKKNPVRHIFTMKSLGFIHRRRYWLETKEGKKYFLGKLPEGMHEYHTYDFVEYEFRKDDVLKAFLNEQ
jgi:hypothetical protein